MPKPMQTWINCGLRPKPLEPLPSPPCRGKSQHIFLAACIPQHPGGKHLVIQRRQRVIYT